MIPVIYVGNREKFYSSSSKSTCHGKWMSPSFQPRYSELSVTNISHIVFSLNTCIQTERPQQTGQTQIKLLVLIRGTLFAFAAHFRYIIRSSN